MGTELIGYTLLDYTSLQHPAITSFTRRHITKIHFRKSNILITMPYQNLTLPTLILTSKIPSRNYSLLFHNFEVILETFGVSTPEGALAKPEIPEKMP